MQPAFVCILKRGFNGVMRNLISFNLACLLFSIFFFHAVIYFLRNSLTKQYKENYAQCLYNLA